MKAEVSLYKKGDVFTGETFKKASSRLGYLYQITVEVKDAKGVLTNDEQAFSCQVTGAGEFLAIDNGNNADLTPPQAKTKKTFNGQLVIYVSRTGKGKINLFNQKYERDMRPIEEGCGCPACKMYSRAYIRHLLKAKEMLGMRLCVLHNLYFYNHLMEEIRDALDAGNWKTYKKDKLYAMQEYDREKDA